MRSTRTCARGLPIRADPLCRLGADTDLTGEAESCVAPLAVVRVAFPGWYATPVPASLEGREGDRGACLCGHY